MVGVVNIIPHIYELGFTPIPGYKFASCGYLIYAEFLFLGKPGVIFFSGKNSGTIIGILFCLSKTGSTFLVKLIKENCW